MKSVRAICVLSCLITLPLIIPFPLNSQLPPPRKRRIMPMYMLKSVRHAVSQPVADMPTEVVVPGAFSLKQQPLHRLPASGAKWPWHKDTAIQSAPGPLLSATVDLSFEGLGAGEYGFAGHSVPPDTEGTVGATQYVQWVNKSFAVFDKSTGSLLKGPIAGNTLWAGFGGGCETDNDGDPIAQYDKLANRWIMTQFAVTSGPPFLQCLAVSQTNDATGKWDLYSYSILDSNGNPAFNDYPKLAVWPDGYYMNWLLFIPGTNTPIGALTCALDRNAMLNGAASANAQCVSFPWANWPGYLLNSDLDGTRLPPAGSPNYLIMPMADLGPQQDFGMALFRYYVNWNDPSKTILYYTNTITSAQYVPLCLGPSGQMFRLVACIPQKGNAQLLDALGDRVMYRLAYRQFSGHDSLLLTHSVSTNAAGNGAPPGGVRWYEFRNVYSVPVCNPTCVWNKPLPTIYQQGTFQPNSTNRWMPSIAGDKFGDIAVGYNMSSTALDPSVGITGRVPTDPLGKLETEAEVAAGTHPQPGENCGAVACGNRWGDYSAMTVDPLDDCTFWYTQEYYRSAAQGAWNTRISSLNFSGCSSMTDFSLSMSPAHNTVAAGSTTTYKVTTSAANGFKGTVTLAATGFPNGATATFKPTTIIGSNSSTLTVKTSASTPKGNSIIRVSGKSGSLSHGADSALSVK